MLLNKYYLLNYEYDDTLQESTTEEEAGAAAADEALIHHLCESQIVTGVFT